MRQRSLPLVVLAAFVLSLISNAPSYAANPGEEVISGSGTVGASGTQTIPIFEPNDVNMRFQVSGGAATTNLVFTVRRGGSDLVSWTVRSGETTWGYTSLAAGDTIQISNPGATTLSYGIGAYARSDLPAIGDGLTDWSGVAAAIGTQSTSQFNVATPGLYRFTLAAASGAFQLKVDENYILKTAAENVALDPEDSTYYLGAGVHTFRIIQSATVVSTEWSVGLTMVGGFDTLPTTESAGLLGGGSLFREEWVPIQVAAGQPVNISMHVTGAATDSLQVELRNGTDIVSTSAGVFGGEILWGTSTLAAGVNALHITADGGNSGPLAYLIQVSTIPSVPHEWQGVSRGNGSNSTITVLAPGTTMYGVVVTLTEGAGVVVIDEQSSITVPVLLEAGSHTVTFRQDPGAPLTRWSVELQPLFVTYAPLVTDSGDAPTSSIQAKERTT
jgi:hypothetical protein